MACRVPELTPWSTPNSANAQTICKSINTARPRRRQIPDQTSGRYFISGTPCPAEVYLLGATVTRRSRPRARPIRLYVLDERPQLRHRLRLAWVIEVEPRTRGRKRRQHDFQSPVAHLVAQRLLGRVDDTHAIDRRPQHQRRVVEDERAFHEHLK